MNLVNSCQLDIHKVRPDLTHTTLVPKRNNRNSFTARVGRKKKKDNNLNNKLIFDEDGNEEIQNNNDNLKIENDFVE